MELLERTLEAIEPVGSEHDEDVRRHLDCLTKPRGSLGRLEDFVLRYCRIREDARPGPMRKRIYTVAGDHGVAAEGVSAFPSEVTVQMVKNMVGGGAAINVLGRHCGAEVVVVDVGVDADLDDVEGVLHRKVRNGTANMAVGPAMSLEEARAAVETGVRLAREAAEDGVTLLGLGEMGIANTTSASALFAALLPCPVAEVTGRGTGVDDSVLEHKVTVVQRALDTNRDRLGSPLATLAALGGLEIAAICGAVLGGAASRIAVVVDGFISTAGALAALRMDESVADYLYFSHRSAERGHRVSLDQLAAEPILDLGLRLGEGTGAALAMVMIEASMRLYTEMATFESAAVSDSTD